ncbi:MAG: sigma-70 family RNA polymerase sigma factor [Caulobacteraceae bacterium]
MAGTETGLKALMLAGLAGDNGAHGALLTGLANHLRAFFRRRLGAGADEAEDLVQETLIAIHLKRGVYDPSAPLTPWVYGIARYKLLDHFRRTKTRRQVPLDDAGELFAHENPEEGGVRHDVDRLLERLPARQRALLRDVKLSGYSMAEAAERGEMSETAAKVAVHRAMKRLEREVGDEDR